MLYIWEKIIFILGMAVSIYFTWIGFNRIVKIIRRGIGDQHPITGLHWLFPLHRWGIAIFKTLSLIPTFQIRPIASLFHALVAWGFIFYILVNTGDILQGFFPNFVFLGQGLLGNLYRLGADLFSICVFIGLIYLLIRRFIVKPTIMQVQRGISLHPKAKVGIQRDSAIVGGFILLHVGGRFIGQTFKIAAQGVDKWQPFASSVANFWLDFSHNVLITSEHITFWFAIGLIFIFLPYFPYSKHIHIFFAPLNFALKPKRRSMGELSTLDFGDENIDQFGATRLEHLSWEQIMDAYACIMCFRCQEVCPAYITGKKLSPAALEINKRYFLNEIGGCVAKGDETQTSLTEMIVSKEAIWACTACAACIDICPVGNEPMRDILDIRRALVLMDNSFPEPFKSTYRGLERSGNPWNIPPSDRMKWAEDLDIPTIAQIPHPDILWWVGCAPAFDVRAQKTAQSFARLLNQTGIQYAVIGNEERCTGDAARRSGKEDLFYELALGNIEMLNEIDPQRIVTTCPHCLHTLKNEYTSYGGKYNVIHHTQLIIDLINNNHISIKPYQKQRVTFHDPCYLGRQNGIFKEPRQIIHALGMELIELPHHSSHSFCCGAGGAQIWKEEEGDERISLHRFKEAESVKVSYLAIGCPFCLSMFVDTGKEQNSHSNPGFSQKDMEILDICELVYNASNTISAP